MAVRNHQLAHVALFAMLSIAHTWPLASDLAHLSRFDHADARLNAWILTWVGRALVEQPTQVFDAPIFHPEPDALAYSESLLLQGALSVPLVWLGASPLVILNVSVLTGLTLTGWATSLVLGRWTGRVEAGILAGCLVAFNTHLLTRLPHVQALHVEFLPLALVALDRTLDRARVRDAAALAAAFVAQALCSGYLLVLTIVALAAAALSRAGSWLHPTAFSLRRVLLLGAAACLAALVLWPALAPYGRVRDSVGLVRSIDEIARYSATPVDYLTTAGRLHFDLWSRFLYEPGTDAFFPGAIAILLALVAIATGTAFRDGRARMLLALGVAGFAFSLGPALPGYTTVYQAVPLLQGLRGAARFGYLVVVAVAGLAAFGLGRVIMELQKRRGWLRTAGPGVALGVIVLVNIEALVAPLDLVRFDDVSPVYRALALESGAVVAEFPFPSAEHVAHNSAYVLAAAYHRRPLVNGYSGFTPPSYVRNAAALEGFPDDPSTAHLRGLGVTHVVVHFDEYDNAVAVQHAVEARFDLVAAAGPVGLYRLR